MRDFFADSDSFIEHIRGAANNIEDDYVTSRYVGFVAVSAITIYEVNVKQLLQSFGARMHPMLGNFASITFKKLNARIGRDDIEKYLGHYGEDYVAGFREVVNAKEREREQEGSVKGSYKNLLTWRHQFVHAGTLPNQATFDESLRAYELGKEVVNALSDILKPETTEGGQCR